MKRWYTRLLSMIWPLGTLFFAGGPPPPPVPDPLEILPVDWTRVSNTLRAVLGYPPYVGPPLYPRLEDLEEWERLIPGIVAQLREQARKEAAHREWMAHYSFPLRHLRR